MISAALSTLFFKSGMIYSFFLAALLEATALLLLPQGVTQQSAPSLVAAFMGHSLAAFVFIAPVYLKRQRNQQDYYFYLVGLLTFFLPGIGLAASLISLVVSRKLFAPQGLASDFEKRRHLLDETILMENPEEIDDFLQAELSTEPLLDILNGKDIELKRGAIKLLRKTGTPDAVKLLKRCLSDSEVEIRFYAHTALSRVEEIYNKRLEKARAQANNPSFESYRELGRAYEFYARSELPDMDLRKHYLQTAAKSFEQALELHPDALDLAVRVGELCVELGDASHAAQCFAKALPTPGLQLDASLGLCRVYFDAGDWPSLAATVGRMREMPSPASEDAFKLVLFKFWTQESPQGLPLQASPSGAGA
jgi:tetratricopeptide (TPR) repeat protein